jgi:nitrogen-specific signal transduction histidine kinase
MTQYFKVDEDTFIKYVEDQGNKTASVVSADQMQHDIDSLTAEIAPKQELLDELTSTLDSLKSSEVAVSATSVGIKPIK